MNAKLDNINIKVRSYNTKREQKAYKAWASKKWHVNSRILLWCWQICCAVVNIDDRPIPKIRFCFFLCSYYHIHSYMQVVLMLFFYICIYPDVYNSEHVFFQTVNWKGDIIIMAAQPPLQSYPKISTKCAMYVRASYSLFINGLCPHFFA